MTHDIADERILPAHIESTVDAIAQLHAEHYRQATPLQRVVDLATAKAGRPGFVAAVTVLVAVWVAINVELPRFGHQPWDAPPFFWMQGLVALGALYITLLILATQRREDQLASRREQLTLELSLLSEQKNAKIIALLEELRRDLPMIRNRVDEQAAAMAVPADPQAVFEAISSTQQDVGSEQSETPVQ